MKNRWLLLGGAGFIGCHVAQAFRESEIEFIVLDNFSSGLLSRIENIYEYIEGDAMNSDLIIDTCLKFEITGIINMAAFMQARESVRDPIKYWKNNLGVAIAIAEALYHLKIEKVILSSSCSVYGNTKDATEETPMSPLSPYAQTKVASEQVLAQACLENKCTFISLRYFNAIGGGEFPFSVDTKEETLIPSVFRNILNGNNPVIFGSSFPTLDGTCERDFIDVRDLADAHVKVATSVGNSECEYLNVSTGLNISVLEIVNLALRISGSHLKPEFVASKKGDPAAISAKPSLRLMEMGWHANYTVEDSITDHWKFITSN